MVSVFACEPIEANFRLRCPRREKVVETSKLPLPRRQKDVHEEGGFQVFEQCQGVGLSQVGVGLLA